MFYMWCIIFAYNSSLVYILMGFYLLKKERFLGMRVALLLGDFLLFNFFFFSNIFENTPGLFIKQLFVNNINIFLLFWMITLKSGFRFESYDFLLNSLYFLRKKIVVRIQISLKIGKISLQISLKSLFLPSVLAVVTLHESLSSFL